MSQINSAPARHTREEIDKIVARLYALPTTALPVIVEFIGFLETRATEANYLSRAQAKGTAESPRESTETQNFHSTIEIAPEKFLSLVGISPGIEGDALVDSEALYDGD